jgi:hypothetical protein
MVENLMAVITGAAENMYSGHNACGYIK